MLTDDINPKNPVLRKSLERYTMSSTPSAGRIKPISSPRHQTPGSSSLTPLRPTHCPWSFGLAFVPNCNGRARKANPHNCMEIWIAAARLPDPSSSAANPQMRGSQKLILPLLQNEYRRHTRAPMSQSPYHSHQWLNNSGDRAWRMVGSRHVDARRKVDGGHCMGRWCVH